MNKTKIQWVKNPDGTPGYTLNPIKGKCPMGCPYCYATRFYDRFHWNPKVRFDASELTRASAILNKSKKPLGVFVCSTFEWLWDKTFAQYILQFIQSQPRHRFYLLTKRPTKLPAFSPFPGNAWVGVTATTQAMYDTAIFYLSQIEASIKYVSVEPLLSYIHLPNYREVDWIIIGCMTPISIKTMPKFEWVELMVNAADRVRTPVFIKPPLSDIMGYHREELPAGK